MEPVKTDSAPAVPRPQEPKQHQPRQQQAPRPPKQHQPKPQQPPKQQPREPQHQPREQPDVNQLPAFLLRPVILPKAPEKPVRTAKKEKTES
jgi:hypothetical protein